MSTHEEVLQEERAEAARLRRLERARKAAEAKRARDAKAKPRRLAQVERRMDELGAEFRRLPPFPLGRERRRAIRDELRTLGQERAALKWGGGS